MAKKAVSKPAAAAKAEPQEIQVQVAFNYVEDLSSYYVNHAEVANTQHEFVILCGRLPAKLSPSQTQVAKEKGKILIDPLVQLTVPPTLIDGLITALKTQKERYEKRHGKIGDQQKGSGDKNVH